MTNITIINPRTAWKSDSGIFYTICLIFILYRFYIIVHIIIYSTMRAL